jgi:hypothetical protein
MIGTSSSCPSLRLPPPGGEGLGDNRSAGSRSPSSATRSLSSAAQSPVRCRHLLRPGGSGRWLSWRGLSGRVRGLRYPGINPWARRPCPSGAANGGQDGRPTTARPPVTQSCWWKRLDDICRAEGPEHELRCRAHHRRSPSSAVGALRFASQPSLIPFSPLDLLGRVLSAGRREAAPEGQGRVAQGFIPGSGGWRSRDPPAQGGHTGCLAASHGPPLRTAHPSPAEETPLSPGRNPGIGRPGPCDQCPNPAVSPVNPVAPPAGLGGNP